MAGFVHSLEFARKLEEAGFRLDFKHALGMTIRVDPMTVVRISVDMALDDGNLESLIYVLKDMTPAPEEEA